jgi:hypothetical protein
MILPNPAYHPPPSRPTCQDIQFAMVYARTVALLQQSERTRDEDADLLQSALCCTECAALVDRRELRLRSLVLLIRAQTALGHHQAAAVQRHRLGRLVGSDAVGADLMTALS